jgi:hypothetical protein
LLNQVPRNHSITSLLPPEAPYIEQAQEGIVIISPALGQLELITRRSCFSIRVPAIGTDQPVGSGAASIQSKLMPQAISPDFPSNSDTEHRSPCEVGRTLRGGKCGLDGEIEFKGALLCARHAREAGIHERIDLLHAVVLSTGLCLKVVNLRRNRALVLRRQRERAARELDLAYEDLRRFEKNDP